MSSVVVCSVQLFILLPKISAGFKVYRVDASRPSSTLESLSEGGSPGAGNLERAGLASGTLGAHDGLGRLQDV